ncbi:hypothetical protein [Paraburkholderia sp.]|uniref:hypothetical protein n=1 Tax=Paraburkholderia sp. TaxID=1926495 RepID=UPI002F3F4121
MTAGAAGAAADTGCGSPFSFGRFGVFAARGGAAVAMAEASGAAASAGRTVGEAVLRRAGRADPEDVTMGFLGESLLIDELAVRNCNQQLQRELRATKTVKRLPIATERKLQGQLQKGLRGGRHASGFTRCQ